MDKIQVEKHITNIKSKFTKARASVYWRAMRMDKPAGIGLALLPSLWALAFAAEALWQILVYFPLFIIGAVVTRGAGCVINDLADRKFDIHVERTASRPIASGELSVRDALYFLAVLLTVALCILLLLPKTAILIGLFTMVPIVLYPYMKRFTYFPQIFLGLTFNLGVLIGWYTIKTTPSFTPIVLYISAVCWTIGYDTIYAHQDKTYDKEIGVKSMALKLEDKTPEALWTLYKLAGLFLALVGLLTHMNLLYYVGWGIAFYHLYWQTQTLKLDNPKNCAAKFESNVIFGLIILASALIGRL